MIFDTISSRDLLIDAYRFYTRKDARAHDALRIIINRNDMEAAVLGCLKDLDLEEDPVKQKLYVQAALFGKQFYPGLAIEEFPKKCRQMRVTNILREKCLNTDDLDFAIEQLIDSKEFELALWMVKWMKSDGENKILEKWCEHMIETRNLTDSDVAARIQKRLGQSPKVSYVTIANKAIEYNREKLAIKLIENEGQSTNQIPLLLSIRQYDLVLSKAVSTYNSNLIYMALFNLKESILNEHQFFELIKKHPLAFKYYYNFLSITDIQKLLLKWHADGMNIDFREEFNLHMLDNRFESAILVSKKNKQNFYGDQAEICVRLDKFQQGLKQIAPPPLVSKPNPTWSGLSISDTIINLVALGLTSKAKDCQRKFDVSDKKYRVLEQIALKILPKLELPTIT